MTVCACVNCLYILVTCKTRLSIYNYTSNDVISPQDAIWTKNAFEMVWPHCALVNDVCDLLVPLVVDSILSVLVQRGRVFSSSVQTLFCGIWYVSSLVL